jgi:hypothetical protein
MYRQLTRAMPSGQRSTSAARAGRLPIAIYRSSHAAPGRPRAGPGPLAGWAWPGAGLLIGRALRAAGLRRAHLEAASLASVGLCIALWIRAKTVDQDERGNAERRAIFVGLWPPTLWLIGQSVGDQR